MTTVYLKLAATATQADEDFSYSGFGMNNLDEYATYMRDEDGQIIAVTTTLSLSSATMDQGRPITLATTISEVIGWRKPAAKDLKNAEAVLSAGNSR